MIRQLNIVIYLQGTNFDSVYTCVTKYIKQTKANNRNKNKNENMLRTLCIKSIEE